MTVVIKRGLRRNPRPVFGGGGGGGGVTTIADTGDPYADMVTLQGTAGTLDGDIALLAGVGSYQRWNAVLMRWFPLVPSPGGPYEGVYSETHALDGANNPTSEGWAVAVAGTAAWPFNIVGVIHLTGFSAGASTHTLTCNGTGYSAVNEATETAAVDAILSAISIGEAVTGTRRGPDGAWNFVNADIKATNVTSLAAGANLVLWGYDGEAWCRAYGGTADSAYITQDVAMGAEYSSWHSGHVWGRSSDTSAAVYTVTFGAGGNDVVQRRYGSGMGIPGNAYDSNATASTTYSTPATDTGAQYWQIGRVNGNSGHPTNSVWVNGELVSTFAQLGANSTNRVRLGNVTTNEADVLFRDWQVGAAT